MHDTELKKKEIEAFLDAGKTIEIPVDPRNNWHRFLQKVGLEKKKVLKYTLSKIKVGNRERISAKGYDFPDEVNNGTYLLKRVFELSKQHGEDLRYCAAVALQNDRFEPSEDLLEALKWVEEEFLFKVLEASLSQVDIANFLNSIVLITGTKSLTKKDDR